MRISTIISTLLFCTATLTALATCAQQESGQDPSSAAGSGSLTAADGFDVRPRNFFGELITGKWSLTGEASVDQDYDDNIFASSVNPVSDSVTRPSLRIGLAVQKKRFSMQFNYSPSYTAYAKYSDRNSLAQSYSQSVGYKWSTHTDLSWVLSANRAASNTANTTQLVDFGGVFVPVFQPQELQSNTINTGFNSVLKFNHALSAQDVVSAMVTGGLTSFSSDNNVPLSALAQKNVSAGASLSWSHQLVPGKSIGFDIGENYFAFLDPSSHSNYQFVKISYSQRFGHGYNVSIGAGPSYSTIQASPGLVSAPGGVSYAVDASLSRALGPRTVGVSYNHGMQQGQIQGGTQTDALSAFFSQSIGRKWAAHGSVSHSAANSPGVLMPVSSNALSVSSGLDYQLARNLSLTAAYSFLSQNVDQSLPGYSGFNHNIFSFGIRYTFRVATER